jgi:hypothetical protein
MSFTGAAVTERSWRALLDTLEPAVSRFEVSMGGGGFVQIGNSCGMEALLTSISNKGFEYCISVLPTKEAVSVANATFRRVLLNKDLPPNLRVLDRACPIAATLPHLDWFKLDVRVLFASQFNDNERTSISMAKDLFGRFADLRVVITTSIEFRDEILNNQHWVQVKSKQRFLIMSSINGDRYPYYILVQKRDQTLPSSHKASPPTLVTPVSKVAAELRESGQHESSLLIEEMLLKDDGVLEGDGGDASVECSSSVTKKKKYCSIEALLKFQSQQVMQTLGSTDFDSSLKMVLYGELSWKDVGSCFAERCSCCGSGGTVSVLRNGVGLQQVGSIFVFTLPHGTSFNLNDATTIIGGRRFLPVAVFVPTEGHQTCIVYCGKNSSWVHANDSVVTPVSGKDINDLLHKSFKPLVIMVDSALIPSYKRTVQGLRNPRGRYCYINCVLQVFAVFEHMFRPVEVSSIDAGGRIWDLCRNSLLLCSDARFMDKQHELIHSELCGLLPDTISDYGGDAMDLFTTVISHAAPDYCFSSWVESEEVEISCCCAAPNVVSSTEIV